MNSPVIIISLEITVDSEMFVRTSLILANLGPRKFKVLPNIENTCFLDGYF